MLILTGKSCSGKDSLSEELIKLGYKQIVTYTSRPMRPNEIDGVTYHYLKLEDFLHKAKEGFFLETKPYSVVDGIWYYGSSLESYHNADENTLCILTPSGIEKLKENNISYIGFYINVSDETIKKRQKQRKDKPKEAERRFNSDKIDFAGVEELIDFTINNEYRDIGLVAREIDKLYRRKLNET